jgi:excisionase family DNA binding protein
MLSVAEAAERVGRSPETVRRWIRMGRLPAVTERGRLGIETADLDSIRDDLYPMLEMPDEWRVLDDGSPAPNWVAAIELTRRGR